MHKFILDRLGEHIDVIKGISADAELITMINNAAKEMGIKTIGLTGNNRDSLICRLSDYCISVPSSSTPRIQEAHILIGHILCEFIENELFGEQDNHRC